MAIQSNIQAKITTQEAMYDQSFIWCICLCVCLNVFMCEMFLCRPEDIDTFEIESEVIYWLPVVGAGIEPSPLKGQNVLLTTDSTL